MSYQGCLASAEKLDKDLTDFKYLEGLNALQLVNAAAWVRPSCPAR
jgi:hypothetical protein